LERSVAMPEEKVRVAFVGGGRTATPLLEDFLERPFITVVGVADVDPDSPGAKVARDHGVFFTTDALIFATKGDEIDVVIEASGDPAVKRNLKSAFVTEGNRHTLIVHDLTARMMLSMSQNSDHLMRTYHPDDDGVGQ
jgi:acetaldehyde dehydrogenase (acetylating)